MTCIYLLTQVSPFDLFDLSQDAWVWRDYLVDNPVDEWLGKVLDKMIANALGQRYQSATAVRAALENNYPSATLDRQDYQAINIAGGHQKLNGNMPVEQERLSRFAMAKQLVLRLSTIEVRKQPRYCRSAARIYYQPDYRCSYFGFRVVCI